MEEEVEQVEVEMEAMSLSWSGRWSSSAKSVMEVEEFIVTVGREQTVISAETCYGLRPEL